MKDEALRTAGISYGKISYFKAIAKAFQERLLDHKKITAMTDEEVIIELTKIKGVGQWTAEMILILRSIVRIFFQLVIWVFVGQLNACMGLPIGRKCSNFSENWRPYRSTACWIYGDHWKIKNNIRQSHF